MIEGIAIQLMGPEALCWRWAMTGLWLSCFHALLIKCHRIAHEQGGFTEGNIRAGLACRAERKKVRLRSGSWFQNQDEHVDRAILL